MWHGWESRGTCIGYWWENQRKRDHYEDRDAGGWITLRWTF
jgi:hypothetical protein